MGCTPSILNPTRGFDSLQHPPARQSRRKTDCMKFTIFISAAVWSLDKIDIFPLFSSTSQSRPAPARCCVVSYQRVQQLDDCTQQYYVECFWSPSKFEFCVQDNHNGSTSLCYLTGGRVPRGPYLYTPSPTPFSFIVEIPKKSTGCDLLGPTLSVSPAVSANGIVWASDG